MATKLCDLDVEQIGAWLASINLDKVLGSEFAEMQIDGEVGTCENTCLFNTREFLFLSSVGPEAKTVTSRIRWNQNRISFTTGPHCTEFGGDDGTLS